MKEISMRFLRTSLLFAAVALAIVGCNSKSSSSTDESNATATSAAATTAPEASGGEATTAPEASNAAATTAPGTDVPAYPGAVTQASGTSSNMNASAAGTVMSTGDAFDKVYKWYQQNLPAGSEKSHVTSPVEGAVFTIGDPGKGQTSVTLSTSDGKTMITIAHVKM
jgi:ABC-type Fe3+-hydroxamate transport system substrate-binding protein